MVRTDGSQPSGTGSNPVGAILYTAREISIISDSEKEGTMEELRINTERVVDFVVSFIRDEFKKADFQTAIIGLSGGVDSAVVASLCKLALGRTNTYGIILPYKDTPKESLDHAYLAGRSLGIRYLRFNITPQIDYYFRNFPQADNIRRGNKMARERMSILYDLSYHFQGLVVGTSNKSEIYLGYGTIHGDLAWAINPIGDLYKTQIYQIAEYLKIPEEIIKKKPSAELWPGQTDEEELGITYQEIDQVLYYYIDKQMNPEDIVKTKGISEEIVKKVINLVKKNEFKRRPAAIARIPDEIKYS